MTHNGMTQVNRKKTRKLVFQKLFSKCFNTLDDNNFQKSFFDGTFDFTIDVEYQNEMLEIIETKKEFFNSIIKKFSPKFNIENMNLLYVLPVYIGMAEMFFLREEIPAKVSINEAVEIAKAYGDESAKRIVNGILNKVMENYEELKEEKK